jgi:hypothetical protein
MGLVWHVLNRESSTPGLVLTVSAPVHPPRRVIPADALGGLDGSGETESSGRGALGSPAGALAFAVETANLTRRF